MQQASLFNSSLFNFLALDLKILGWEAHRSFEDDIFLKTRPQMSDDYDFITWAQDDASLKNDESRSRSQI